ncbi:leucine-rich repeat domain-containing protein [Anatilimnocola floriformis]|uniref:leucine-rich repeat domain-containing protein n=1 Tax=Anatilimnocola floriformis TaxID=2948575 RepID=UPI0020C1F1D9|nr:hypothetical protein [Anatilimnocola floriformis]
MIRRFFFLLVAVLANSIACQLQAADPPAPKIEVEESLFVDGEFDATITGGKFAGQTLFDNRELQQAAPKTNGLMLKKCTLDADIDVILKPFPKLKELYLIDCQLSPKTNLGKSARLADLTSFTSERTPLTDADLAFTARAKKLESLEVPGANLKGTFLDGLAGSKSLLYLLLGENQIPDEKCEVFATIKSLRRLNLSQNGLSDKAAPALAKCTMLQILHLEKNKLTDAGGAQFARLTAIDQLYLDDNKVTARGLEGFRGSKTLRHLSVENCGIDEAFLAALRGSFQTVKK